MSAFMSGPTGQPGMGPELSSLINQSPNSGMGAPTLQNSTNPGGPVGVPQAPNTQALPEAMVRPGGAYSTPQQPQAGYSTQQGMPLQQGAPELQIALNALSNYVQAHAKAHMANHEVPRKEAEAKLISSQIPNQGGR